jgi:ABC-type Fe3+-hydroxamate transport system substrate-binding protein
VEGAIEAMAALARLTGAEEAAAPYLADTRAALEEARRIAAGHAPVPFFCAVWKEPWMSASDDTYLADLLKTCGGRNVFGGEGKRYPRVPLEEAAGRNPALVLLPTEPYAFAPEDREAVARAVPAAEVLLVDGTLLAWHGVRTAAGLRACTRLFAGDRKAASPKPP